MSNFLHAQKVLLEQHLSKDTVADFFGPNLKHFMHFNIGFGFVSGNQAKGAQVEYGRSTSFLFGIRYKRKISNYYAVGFCLDYNNINYSFKQDSSKLFPDNTLHYREFLKINNFNLELYNRLNFDKRGNYIGKYLDLGFYGNLPFSSTHQYHDNKVVASANKTKVINSGLKYLSSYNYGLTARLGSNRLAVYLNYRLSNQFKTYKLSSYDELPRIIVGLQLGLFQ
jgi:hypothetical protein